MKEFEQLWEMWKPKSIVIFTGAGMSTESGLPDFRSGEGLWQRFNPMELATIQALKHNYDEFHAFYTLRLEQAMGVLPNSGHQILANWEKAGWIQSIITQNVDGLHQVAGSNHVHELHGRLRDIFCFSCNQDAAVEDFLAKKECGYCGGKLRPGIVLFGEALPQKTFSKAQSDAQGSSVFLVLGSSLQVSPANYLPQIAKEFGAYLGICNESATPMDEIFAIRSSEKINRFLEQLNNLLIDRPKI